MTPVVMDAVPVDAPRLQVGVIPLDVVSEKTSSHEVVMQVATADVVIQVATANVVIQVATAAAVQFAKITFDYSVV